jgi:hypothetical protein
MALWASTIAFASATVSASLFPGAGVEAVWAARTGVIAAANRNGQSQVRTASDHVTLSCGPLLNEGNSGKGEIRLQSESVTFDLVRPPPVETWQIVIASILFVLLIAVIVWRLRARGDQ